MTRKGKKKLPLLEKVPITGIAAEGKALARVSDKVLFVPFAAPGDVVDVQVVKSRKNYMEGVIRHVHQYSEDRTLPFCSHFGTCGGCRWQHIPYEKQLVYKQQQVIDSLERIGGLNLDEVVIFPILASEKTTCYRNKLEFTFSHRRWLSQEEIKTGREIEDHEALGFHIPGQFDKVLDIEKCWLQEEPSNDIRLAIKDFAVREQLPFFDLRSNTGFLRNLIIRNTGDGAIMVVMVFGEDNPRMIHKMMSYIDRSFPGITSLYYMLNTKANSSIADLDPVLFKGDAFIQEKMEGLSFRIGPKSFFQTNSLQAYRLYETAREFAALTGNETLYDLYTGTGTIACFMAKQAKTVTGIEYVDEAVAHARENARQNNLLNIQFLSGDMASLFTTGLMDKYGYPDVIITDPPRAGMHPKVIDQLLLSGADRIVYVSCNPATQARDIALLSGGYRLVKSQALDMFPHTHHVEHVALLLRNRI